MLVTGFGVLCVGPKMDQFVAWLDTFWHCFDPLQKKLVKPSGLIEQLP